MAAGGKPSITAEWLLEVCGAERLASVKSVNLWAKSLTDADVTDVLAKCTSLEVASLSLNKLTKLEPFAGMIHMKELFLRKNEVADINELKHLQVRDFC